MANGLQRAVVAPADVADPAAVVRALDQTEAELGPIDIAVNCAGVIGPAPLTS